ncbi:hypothetical protein SXCC_02254 [Gluconacetobacter sp. SXCC-1]|nr:hypothetical protein SXCC_02254 [Gluconacetobacter sp. SXCC-1]
MVRDAGGQRRPGEKGGCPIRVELYQNYTKEKVFYLMVMVDFV